MIKVKGPVRSVAGMLTIDMSVNHPDMIHTSLLSMHEKCKAIICSLHLWKLDWNHILVMWFGSNLQKIEFHVVLCRPGFLKINLDSFWICLIRADMYVCVLLHVLNICVSKCLSCSREWRSRLRAAASNRWSLSSPLDFDCFKVLTPWERRSNQIFSLRQKKNPTMCVLTRWLIGRGSPPTKVPHTHVRSCHGATPGIPLIFPGILFHLNAIFSPLFSFDLV